MVQHIYYSYNAHRLCTRKTIPVDNLNNWCAVWWRTLVEYIMSKRGQHIQSYTSQKWKLLTIVLACDHSP